MAANPKPTPGHPLTLTAYAGDASALLAFDVDESLRADLAGFALEYTPPGGTTQAVGNRLTFGDPIVAATTPAERRAIFTSTRQAPLQKFHWVHFPPDVPAGAFTYTATAMLFKAGSETEIEPGPSASVKLDLRPAAFPNFKLGFTRGYVSSQAYHDSFENAAFVPSKRPLVYDTAPFEAQYAWLGFDARRLMFEVLDEALADTSLELDVFAYDLDEPDIIDRLAKLGPRLRLMLDDSKGHVGPHDFEPQARAVLEQSAGADRVKVGHFQRQSHSKVLIQRRGRDAIKVLAGSANFAVRGLYVQSNNVFVFDDPETAGLYEQAFVQAFTQPLNTFAKSPIAGGWFTPTGAGLPPFSVSFSPHTTAGVSLDRVGEAIENARESVLFAVMDIGGSKGRVTDALRALPGRDLYAFGTTQRLDGALKVTSPSDPHSPFIPFAFLKSKVPAPFNAEISGGSGQVIHHKFVVCDFNGENPVAFAGSSNLAGGGEEENGDNLVEFRGSEVVTPFAIEAIKLADHYRFRAVQQKATETDPLRLKGRSEDWSAPYFDPSTPKFRERLLFAR
ncbi:MAG: hypothetical protein QOJ35_2591 [Solirubrobacteraceae bacterium]|jgi:phosphatidylserine/phosphatidylglycerophosphate/cardiolipin synthase-like enzyme|nr:hypothetical protein [Solirubrobacteraceae bacterium]